jgi:hypothetical protein
MQYICILYHFRPPRLFRLGRKGRVGWGNRKVQRSPVGTNGSDDLRGEWPVFMRGVQSRLHQQGCVRVSYANARGSNHVQHLRENVQLDGRSEKAPQGAPGQDCVSDMQQNMQPSLQSERALEKRAQSACHQYHLEQILSFC